MHAHNAIRFELDGFAEALAALQTRRGADSPLPWEMDAIRLWWAAHEAHVHSHHDNEDNLFNPFLRQRFHYPEKLETDHVGLVKQMEVIKALVAGDEMATAAKLAKLREEWARYSALMKPHLAEEETVGLPLMRAFFMREEIGQIAKQMLGKDVMTTINLQCPHSLSLLHRHSLSNFGWVTMTEPTGGGDGRVHLRYDCREVPWCDRWQT